MNEISNPNKLVSVYQGANITEAHMVRNLLLDEEIDAEVSERAASVGDFACDVIVRAEDEAKARAILKKSKP